MTTPDSAASNERAAFFADKAAHLLREIAEYENTHPDDAPCLHGQHIEIDGKQVTIKVHEWGIG